METFFLFETLQLNTIRLGCSYTSIEAHLKSTTCVQDTTECKDLKKQSILLPSQTKKKSSSLFFKAKKVKYSISSGSVLLVIFLFLATINAFGVLRFVALSRKNNEVQYLSRAILTTVKIYDVFSRINVIVDELILWEADSTVEYHSPLQEYQRVSGRFNNILLHELRDLLEEKHGASSDLLTKLMDFSAMKVITGFEEQNASYVGLDDAMSGILNHQLKAFFQKYINLYDQFVVEWSRTRTRQDRLLLLRRDMYSSMIAYSFFNPLPFIDSFYYHISQSIWLQINEVLSRFSSMIDLANVLVFLTLLTANTILYFAVVRRYVRLLRTLSSLLYTVPVKVLETNAHMKQMLSRSTSCTRLDYN